MRQFPNKLRGAEHEDILKSRVKTQIENSIAAKRDRAKLFPFLQDSEYVGDTFQDEENRAALLLYKDREDDALLMVRFVAFIFILTPQISGVAY